MKLTDDLKIHRSIMIALVLCSTAFAQTPAKNSWSDWQPFLGTWEGTGGGDPGQGKGAFTFAQDLQGAVLTRHNFAEYPATKDKPAYRHDDVMIIYRDTENHTRADYWDSEGHVIRYEVTMSPEKLVFLSDANQPGPRFRLTYTRTDANTVSITFDIAPPNDPTAFKTYIQASAKRKAS
jgi:hypothetical protein